MHCCLTVCAAAKVREAGTASRAVSVAALDDKSTAKSTAETTASLLYFMAYPLLGRKHRVLMDAAAYLQPLVACNSFRTNAIARLR